MDLINAKEVSINFFLWVKKQGAMSYTIFICSVLYRTVRMHLGVQKTKLTAQLLFLIFPEETLASHFKPKNLRFEFLLCNPPLTHLYNYQTQYITFVECF